MSYIKHFKFVQNSTSIDFKALSKGDIIKVEKLLKADQQFNDNFNSSSISSFLESIHNDTEGISFLNENPNFIAIVSNSFKFKKAAKIVYKKEDETKIKTFFSNYLEQDLINCCNVAFKKGQYSIVTELLRYRHFLPASIIHFIESKTESKLDYYLNTADKVNEDNTVFSQPFNALLTALNVKRINDKRNQLISITTSYSMKAIGRSGLSNFFYVIITALSWVGRHPQTIEEKIEKREVMKDFKFISILLGFIFFLFFGVVIYTNSQNSNRKKSRETAAKQRFNKSIYGYLTNYDSTQVQNIEHLKNTLSGELKANYIIDEWDGNSLLKKITIVNNSDHELIILPDKDFVSQFQLIAKTYYVKPKDSIKANLFYNRIYIGKQLALFKTPSNNKEIARFYNHYYSKNLPRFLEPIPVAEKLIKIRFEIRSRIELNEKDNKLFLESNHRFGVNGARYKSYPIK